MLIADKRVVLGLLALVFVLGVGALLGLIAEFIVPIAIVGAVWFGVKYVNRK